MRIRTALLAAVLATPLALTSAQAAPAPARAAGPAAPRAAALTADPNCDPTKSVRPSSDESGAGVSRIKARGYLIAGVDQNDYRWGFRDRTTGQLAGFDIDIVHALAKAILGDPNKVQYKTIPTAKRIEAIKTDQVDVIARTMTITCQRLDDVAFSTVYFQAGQQVLVPKTAKAKNVDEALKGKTVCVSDGSTAQDQLKQNPRGAAAVKPAPGDLDCLVLMQLGQADAALTDNAVAVGMAAQDPNMEVVGPSITSEPYGVAISRKYPDLVARVNQVLEDYRHGGWQDSYHRWLEDYLGKGAVPPAANYLP
jgi:polar amino acid transport system substrate-binding protein